MTDDRPPCQKCQRVTTVKLRRQIMHSGGTQIFWHCISCNRSADSKFISKQKACRILRPFGKTIEDLPIENDYREGGAECEVCGAFGAEYHHWLPQCFAEQVPNHSAWPASFLCKPCHDIWHELVTPYLPGRGHSEHAQYTKEKYLWLEQAA